MMLSDSELFRWGTAVLRLEGIPVSRFRIKDISRNGTCFLVRENSTALRNLRIGQQIEIQFQTDGIDPAVLYRSEIMHITKANRDPFKGYFMVGVKIVSKLTLE